MVFPSGKFMDISTFSSGIYIAEVILGNKKMNKILLEIFLVFFTLHIFSFNFSAHNFKLALHTCEWGQSAGLQGSLVRWVKGGDPLTGGTRQILQDLGGPCCKVPQGSKTPPLGPPSLVVFLPWGIADCVNLAPSDPDCCWCFDLLSLPSNLRNSDQHPVIGEN